MPITVPTTERFLDEVVLHTTAFADAVHAAGQEARVPTCPEWSARDLAEHLGAVHRWCAGTVSRPGEKLVRRGPTDPPIPESDDEVSTWLLEGAATLTQAIRAAGEDTLVGGFGALVPVSFWARRQCHETLVHRADAEIAAGRDPLTDVDPVIAADAVDEHLAMVALSAQRRPDLQADGATLHLHATDEGIGDAGEWVVTLGAGGPVIEHAHRKSDTAVRGPARALLTVLTSREHPEDVGVDVLGAADLLTLWRQQGGV
ncbi:maleylpyruvate isomerase family mycothiol-dependent enzyme [Actinomycetospora straminea]|uniref:Maleylpyruvate isomerase family mycothiol-dependent enzyme n=1 Tax=Actinomycetospora straminea TaxID=663607 RepID=A0ABP9ESM9_9PSEU|nr:maleylpyruvate isomerase family mycothiol-dependent enzyme [Actinomycetospora straminea]MDD7934024.1 maleylpyruvate isomerase family mycothiol-dependent enzyme [Actinomycetospora straminea]